MRIDQDDKCLSGSGGSRPRLCFTATINDQVVLHTSEASSCHGGQPRLSSDDLDMRMTEADCSFREINFEDRSTELSLGLPGGLARSATGQVVSLGEVRARFGLKSSGHLNGNAIFVSSPALHLLKGVKMESVSGESLNNKTTASF